MEKVRCPYIPKDANIKNFAISIHFDNIELTLVDEDENERDSSINKA